MIAGVTWLAAGLGRINAPVLTLGRGLGIACVALMVGIMLAQVFFRYVVGTALAWPEEATRFLMLWMAGLMVPSALRRSGFVSIDMVVRLLPRAVAALLSLLLLALSLVVLIAGLRIGWSEVTGLGGRFETDSLRVPASFDLSVWQKVPRAWMMASLVVGIALMISVTVELMLRSIVTLLGGADGLLEIPHTATMGAE